ncbi:uncharacterized protein LOC116628538 isoform X2 [Phoca vitulina]|uniref:uncharacterized protein LOC116628538 isoform X2 n=1 Tax=Phoca vitulina TaxID=9720 RepID=UPI001396586C|nr:uncharacterized protein LOC116628538 isoform X2 [Phoca vitulina]
MVGNGECWGGGREPCVGVSFLVRRMWTCGAKDGESETILQGHGNGSLMDAGRAGFQLEREKFPEAHCASLTRQEESTPLVLRGAVLRCEIDLTV